MLKILFKNTNLLRTLPIRHFSVYNVNKTRHAKRDIGSVGWCLLIVPAATFCLGTWQLQRKKWKEGLIRDLKDRSQTDPVVLPHDLNEINKLEYCPVHVKGRYLHDREIYMGPRTLLEGGEASTESSLMSKNQNKTQGYLVITPFKLADRDETILINRGWISGKYRDPAKRQEGQIEKDVNVIGVVRLHENRPPFMPTNKMESKLWFYRDLHQMCEATGTSPIFLDATTDFPIENGPIAGQTRISLRNEHLSYILTWYSLSAITSYMWYKHFIKRF